MEMEFPIPDLATIGKSLKDFYDYWKKFKGKKIRIIGPASNFIKELEDDITLHSFREIIEGIVDAIQTYPPGLILKNVEEFVKHESSTPIYDIKLDEPKFWINYGGGDKRQIFNSKFVSFNFIQSIEFLES